MNKEKIRELFEELIDALAHAEFCREEENGSLFSAAAIEESIREEYAERVKEVLGE